MSTPKNFNVMQEDGSQKPQTELPAFNYCENGQCPGSIAKRMRRFEAQNNRNANAIWSEWVVTEGELPAVY